MVGEQVHSHQQPCADLVELRQVCRGLVEDRQRLNGSFQRIEGHIGELHEKVNGIALLNEREVGNLRTQTAGLASAKELAEVKQNMTETRLEMQRTLSNAGWKILGAMMTAGLGLGSALTMFVLNRLVP